MTRFAVIVLPLAALLLVACGSKTGAGVSGSAREDAGMDAGSRRDAGTILTDGGAIPDGARPDARACPAPCDDGLWCNGPEYCEETTGTCMPGLPPGCDDGDECTIDSCSNVIGGCEHVPMDRDEDGDGVSACEGDCDDTDPGVRPDAPEVCDTVDQDCDGAVDEGTLSECRDCRPGCRVTDMPSEVAWEPDEDNSSGVEIAPDGTLRLSSERTEFHFAWIANHLFGTITKLDTRTGVQAAEDDAVLSGPDNGAAPPGERCLTTARGGNCPSRTAVDLRGSVYVANRAFFGQGTVTKIAGLPEDCVDKDGDGAIETSQDLDADGVIERTVDGEFLGQDDECLLWTVDVGGIDGVPRAIAVAADGTVWVGLHNAQEVYQLDPDDGSIIQRISVGHRRFSPYGAAIAGDGTLWLAEAGTGRIVAVDTTTGDVGRARTAVGRDACSGSYGIAVDAMGRVWVAGFQCDSAFRYDPDSGRWMEVRLPDSGAGRGIAADDRGFIWMAASHEDITIGPGGIGVGEEVSRVTRFRADDGSDVRIWDLPGLSAIGVGLDPNRNIWVINQTSSTAARLDPSTGAMREYPTGESPYTYSDFTGFALRTFTAPNGYLRTVVEGCAVGPTEWEIVRWDASTPGPTEVQVRVRAAATRAELGSTPWIGPFRTTPSDLVLPPGPVGPERFLEVEVMLVSGDERSTPRVRSVSVQYNCPI